MACRLIFLFLFAFVFQLRAHDPGLSTLQLKFDGQQLHATTTFATADIAALTSIDANADGKVSADELAAEKTALEDLVNKLLEISVDNVRTEVLETACSLDEKNNFQFDQKFTLKTGSLLKVVSRWFDILPPGHRQFVSYQDETGEVIAEDLLDEQSKVFEVSITPVTTAAGIEGEVARNSEPTRVKSSLSFSKFFVLGIEHILTGYDHLLFLFALLIVCESFASIVKIVTCFTLAHSLTLALATFDVVQIPGNIVEPIIAASIVYVGVENILRRGHPKGRWLLTFAFGLVHGFGFAGVLRELGIGQSGSVAVPLISFNLGVEFGQICVAAIILPILWRLKKWPKFTPRFVPACSVLVAAAGTFWFIQRVWF